MRFFVLLAAAILVPSVALAQPDKKAPPSNCTELVKSFGLIDLTPDSTIADRPDGCVFSNVFAGFGAYNRVRLGEVTLKSPTLFADLAADSLPSALELTISGFQLAPETGSALNNYIIEVQSTPLDIHFAYVWDKAARTVELTDFSVTAPEYGAYRVSARASDVVLDPEQLDDPENIPGAIDALTIDIENARFLSSMLVPPLLGYLPSDDDPRPLIETFKTAAIAFITGLPSAKISDDTKAALTEFVAAFPRPTGDYTLAIAADPGLKFTALLVDNPIQLAALLARLQLTATHTPLKQP